MRRGEGLMAERREGATGQRGGRGRGQGAPAPDEGTLTSCLALAARHADVELGEAAWGLLAAALGEGRAPSAPAYQAYVNLFGAAGDLPRAFGAQAGMAALQARKSAGERVPRLAPALLVAASSKA